MTLSMVSRKNYNLNTNEGLVIFLTTKLITCFIGDFTLILKPQSIAHYSMEVNIYIEFWTLRVKCTQYGICG